MLLQVGSDDTLGGPRSVERLARAYRTRGKLSDVEVRVYEGARHEVYNETNRDEVVGDLVACCGARSRADAGPVGTVGRNQVPDTTPRRSAVLCPGTWFRGAEPGSGLGAA